MELAAHWTLQMKNHGNFEGEAANQPGAPSLFGDYPESFSADRNFPYGRLDDFQRHKIRAWTTYLLDVGRFGDGRSVGAVALQLGPHLQPARDW